MKFKVVLSKDFDKQISKLGNYTRLIVLRWIQKNLENCENPRSFGAPLKGKFKGLWRYRIGDYRLIVDIKDDQLIILMLNVGHRKDVYEKFLQGQ